jgi:xanthine dehydrogenase accessory factor
MQIEKHIYDLKKNNQPFVVATVVKAEGSVPGKVGFKMIIQSDNEFCGTVGGGAIELEVIQESLERLKSSESGTKEYLLSKTSTDKNEKVKTLPMHCSGRVWIFYEVHGLLSTLYLFGGGHVGNALLYYLRPLNYHTILIDNRPEFANKEKNPNANEIHLSDYIVYASTFQPKENSFAVIMTHGHNFDYLILQKLFERKLKFKYIGVIASKTKAETLVKDLKKEFGDDLDLSMLHSPVGLDIGGTSASEIALSVAGEMQSIKYRIEV